MKKMTNIILSAEGLSKRFNGLQAVKNLSLNVEEGEVFGFLGPNGAGKTTTIRMLTGLLRPDGGRVLLNGQVMQGGDAAARAQVGVCPQEVVIWKKLTCLEQLVFTGQLYGLDGQTARRNALRLLDELDLAEKRNSLSGTLSGGMQRRLNIALALVHDPRIVVLDEPEAGLDPQNRVGVREYVQSLAHRKTDRLTTHNMDEAERVADRVAIIDHGELLVLDTPEQLKRQVGEGDVLEIGLKNGRRDEEAAQAALSSLAANVQWDEAGAVLRVRALDAVGRLAQILGALEAAGFQPGAVNIRANTLEDVFIQLTGRRLRE
ncbi:MAG: ABC transporter ATP-binding protein [Anaerolineae bacterium]|nr:ABC transporter ATP-binding protein [Anaerolineae bacterium]